MTWVLDLDGVVWHGTKLLEGAAVAIERLRNRGIRVGFLTNNSTLGSEALVGKFASLGIEVEAEDILSAHDILVQRIGSGKRILATTSKTVLDSLRASGNEVFEPRQFIGDTGELDCILDLPEFDMVVSGQNPALDYWQLSVGVRALLQCRTHFAANRDPLYPSTRGMALGTGSIVAALETASGVKATVVGKPEHTMVEAMFERFPDVRVVVGDQFAIDGLFAQRAKVPFGHVLSGVDADRPTNAADVPYAHQAKNLAAMVDEFA